MRPLDAPAAPPPYDERQITPLNQSSDVLVAPPALSGLRGRLASFVWRLVAPTLQKQATLNSLLVDHVNRNVAVHRATQAAVADAIAAVQRHVDDLAILRNRLLLYLQQITPYVDTRD